MEWYVREGFTFWSTKWWTHHKFFDTPPVKRWVMFLSLESGPVFVMEVKLNWAKLSRPGLETQRRFFRFSWDTCQLLCKKSGDPKSPRWELMWKDHIERGAWGPQLLSLPAQQPETSHEWRRLRDYPCPSPVWWQLYERMEELPSQSSQSPDAGAKS